VSVVADDGDTAGEPVGDVVGIGVGGGGSATALRHTTLIRTSASSLAVISHDGIDASSRNGAGRTGGPSLTGTPTQTGIPELAAGRVRVAGANGPNEHL
jgi:hypothetical protein